MREILFRGKRLDNGEWVEGYYAGYGLICVGEPEDTYNATGEYCGQTPYVGFVEVDPATVGQYTGLTDKNGKRIFEGDVIKGLLLFGLEVLSVVDFEGGSFGLKWNRGDVAEFSPFTSICNVSFEVIGNIHDNRLEDFDGG